VPDSVNNAASIHLERTFIDALHLKTEVLTETAERNRVRKPGARSPGDQKGRRTSAAKETAFGACCTR
jgi:hypothetical protein